MNESDLRTILARKGYGIKSTIKSSIGERSVASSLDRAREDKNLESTPGDESLRSKATSYNYAGIVKVRLKFFRKRLADYSRAISEKALVDGLVYAGIILGDSSKEILLEDEGQVKVDKDSEERTEINIEYPEFDFDNPIVPRTRFGNMGDKKK